MFKHNSKEDICVRPERHNTQFIEALARYDFIKSMVKGGRVLDGGCGFGYGAAHLSSDALEVTGVDSNKDAISYAKRSYCKNNVRFILADLTKLDIPDEYFDSACFFEVIHQVEEYEKLVDGAARVLKRGGLLAISTRNVKKESGIPAPFHLHEFDALKMKTLLLKSGFRDIEIYGVGRPPAVNHLEAELVKIRKNDFLGLRNIIPRKIISFLIYTVSGIKKITPPQNLNYSDFLISRDTADTAVGILAIGRKS